MIGNRRSAQTWKRILREQLQGEQRRSGVKSRPAPTPTFVEVRVPESSLRPKTSGIELWLPGRRRVRVRPGFDRRTLLDLLAALESCPPGVTTREAGV